MVQVVEQNPTDLILVMADMARANPPLSGAFLAEMTRHLQGQSPHFAFANSWLEQRLAEQGLTIEQLVQADGQAQAADQVSMGNSINSLRFLSSNDWREFVENHSLVEQILRGRSGGRLRRHGLRHARSLPPRGGGDRQAEPVVGARRRAQGDSARPGRRARPRQKQAPERSRTAHVGYYLIDRGRSALERSAAMRLSPWIVAARIGRRYPLFFYLVGVLLITAVVTAAFLAWSSWRGADAIRLCLLAIPFLMCAAHLGVGVVNWLATLLVQPRPLPRLDFRDGIPPEHRTMVVVPTMLSNPEAVAGPAGRARSALPGQPRRQPPFRSADGS